MDSALSEIQSCEWLLLRTMDEPRPNALRVVVEEARAGARMDAQAAAVAASLPALASILQGARPISHEEGGVICGDHILDVVSTEEPEVRVVAHGE